MTRIDFYNLSSSDDSSLLNFASRLSLKVWRSNHSVYIHCDDEAQALELKEHLENSDISTVIAVTIANQSPHAQVHLGYLEEHAPTDLSDVMVNLSKDLALCFSRFHRLLELTNQQDERKAQKRKNYQFYRNKAYPLSSHNIT